MRCTLNVTGREYDKILQLTHDAIEWANTDPHIVQGVGDLLGKNVAVDLSDYDEIRMEMHANISGLPRVEPRWNFNMDESKKRDPRAADIPAQNPPPVTAGRDEPFPRGSTIEETNSDRDIEEKQTVSGD